MKRKLLFLLFTLVGIFSCQQKSKVQQPEESVRLSTVESNQVFINSEEIDKNVNQVKSDLNNSLVDYKNENKTNEDLESEIDIIRKNHECFINENPFKEDILLDKSERKAAGLPPNKYFEQEWILEMNPYTGKPTPENLSKIRKQLEDSRIQSALSRIPGDGTDNSWVERGPNNVGGRTRAIIFDPTDTNAADGITVIAGGVSGGLWKNTNIASAGSNWIKMTLPEHLNVQTITVDPNNSNIWYVGTGESYVFGDVDGNGLWKSLDAGLSWFQVFGGGTVNSISHLIQRLDVVSPSNGAVIGSYTTGLPAFGNPVVTPITAGIALVNDGAAPTDDACSSLPANSMNGKIALIRRGSCSFESKVLMAQNAGAVAAIIMNNVAGGGVINMAGDGSGATIPCVMISKEDGDLLVANLTNLTGTINPAVQGEYSGVEVQGVQVLNDVAIKNNGGNSEIFVALGDGYYSSASVATYNSPGNYGVYKSTDGGNTWTKLNLPLTTNGNDTCPNDIEIGTDGRIWVSSTDSWTFGDGGGRVFGSSDGGNTFNLVHTVTGNGGGKRVQIEASHTNPNKIYILSELDQANPNTPTTEVKLELTTNGFGSVSTLTLPPATGETRLTTYGFTGAQAFYDLVLESDPSNDNIIIAGGINLAKSTNSGGSWTQISNWSGGNGVHSDQHAIVFNPNNTNMVLFGNDGGVYYCSSLSGATNSSSSILARNSGFNVTQFVGVAVAPLGMPSTTNDFFVAGAQDNGSNYFASGATSNTGVSSGINSSIEIQGGDGGIPLFSQDSDKYYITNYVYNSSMNRRGVGGAYNTKVLENTQNGLFYPAMALDSNLDIVYSEFYDYTAGTQQIRRISGIKSTSPFGGLTKTNLTNALLTSFPTALTVSPYTTGSTRLFVGTMNGKLLRLDNANATPTWNDISGPNFIGSISDVEFGTNENQIFVTFHNYGVTNVWYTPNGGANWYSIEGNLPDLPVKAIVQNPLETNEIMIGTDLGVWYSNTFDPTSSSDQSLVWRQSFNGMSNVKVTDMDIQKDLTNPNKFSVYAATYGRGVFSAEFWSCGALTTTWNGSTWSNGVPTSKTAVTFAGNYNSSGDLDACSVVVNSGVNVTFNTGHTLRVGDDVSVNGTGSLTFENNSALVQYAKHAVNSGNILVKRDSAPMIRLDYTGWSSPVVGQQLLAFSPNTVSTRFYEYLYTGTTTPTAYQSVDPSTNFVAGKGYMIRVDNTWPASTYTSYNGQFYGVPNNGTIVSSIGNGYNLLGNPYPSPISAQRFIEQNARVRTLYFWTHNVPQDGSYVAQTNFSSYTLLGGVAAIAGGQIPNDKIQTGQAFYVNSIGAFDAKFENELREDASTTSQFFKSSTNTNESFPERHRLWLNLKTPQQPLNQIMIGYMQGASNNVDGTIDGLVLDTSKSILYNLLEDKEYVIQGRSLPFDDNDVVKLGLKTLVAGNYSIEIETFDGMFENTDVFLKDKQLAVLHNLKETSYTFFANEGIDNDRFEIVYKQSSLSDQSILENNLINIFTSSDGIKIQSTANLKDVVIYNVLGKIVYEKSNLNSPNFTISNVISNNETLIVKATDSNGKIETKKIIY